MLSGLVIEEQDPGSVVALLAGRGVAAHRIGQALDLELPQGPTWTSTNGVIAMGTGPMEWLLCAPANDSRWIDGLRERLGILASVSEQSGAYSFYRLSGSDIAPVMQRAVAIDLGRDRQPFAIRTIIAHTDVIIRRTERHNTFEIAVYRSYAKSFEHWLRQLTL